MPQQHNTRLKKNDLIALVIWEKIAPILSALSSHKIHHTKYILFITSYTQQYNHSDEGPISFLIAMTICSLW